MRVMLKIGTRQNLDVDLKEQILSSVRKGSCIVHLDAEITHACICIPRHGFFHIKLLESFKLDDTR